MLLDRKRIENWYMNRGTLAVYYGVRVLLLLAFFAFLGREEWESAVSTLLIALVMSLPSLLKRFMDLYIPFVIDLAIVIWVFLTLFLGQVAKFYDHIPLWDKFIHFQSGLLLGCIGFVLVYLLNEPHGTRKLNMSPGFVAVFAVAFSLALGAVWEMCEFAGDAYFHSHWQIDNNDTMWDLIADGSGALIISILGYFWMYRHKRLPFTPWRIRLRRIFKSTRKESGDGQ